MEDFNERASRMADLATKNGMGDTDPAVWAVRAAGIVSTLVANPEHFDKDKIIDVLEQLFALMPTILLAEVVVTQQKIKEILEDPNSPYHPDNAGDLFGRGTTN